MFLWARLVLQYISKNMFYTKEEILVALKTLPRKLSELYVCPGLLPPLIRIAVQFRLLPIISYRKILSQIMESFDARSTQRLKSVFGWIAYAKRPLKEFEFQSALAFGCGETAVGKVAPSHLFTMCAPLIEKRKDSTYSFIHVSVKS